MRIGIMLRSIQDKGGIGVYTRNLTQELITQDRENEYVLFYQLRADFEFLPKRENVQARWIQAPNKVIWDQASIPIACLKDNIDVLLHPKFTVPLLASCPAVMVLHGAGWFLPEYQKFWSRSDVRIARITMPLYCRRASALVSVSKFTTNAFNRLFRLPPGKIRTVYFAPGRQFRRISDPRILERVRQKYSLPDRFILTLSGYERGDRKNFNGILNAFKIYHETTNHELVVGGKGCDRFRAEYHIPDTGYGTNIYFPGWIDQEDLPAIYSLADLFLYPSHLEAFPIPLTEAMACGTPIITSNSSGLAEIAGEAALFVDPGDPQDVAGGIKKVLTDPDLSSDLSRRALERAKTFSWQKCAGEILEILQEQVRNGKAHAAG